MEVGQNFDLVEKLQGLFAFLEFDFTLKSMIECLLGIETYNFVRAPLGFLCLQELVVLQHDVDALVKAFLVVKLRYIYGPQVDDIRAFDAKIYN